LTSLLLRSPSLLLLLLSPSLLLRATSLLLLLSLRQKFVLPQRALKFTAEIYI
jgi:hypothetical protein